MTSNTEKQEEEDFLKRIEGLTGNNETSTQNLWSRSWNAIRHPNEAQKLGHHVFWQQIISLLGQAISPFAALRRRWLAATAGVASARSLISGIHSNVERSNYINIYNKAVESLIAEAMTTMPEIEREFKARRLEKNINTIGNELGTFYRNRFQKIASFLGIGGAGLGLIALNPWLLTLAAPAYGLGRWMSSRRKYIQNVVFPHEWKARFNVWDHQDGAIRNPEVHAMMGDTEKQKQELKRAQEKLFEITEARRKKELPMIWIQVGAYTMMTGLALVAGYFNGMSAKQLVGLYAATNAFLGSVGSWITSSYAEKETLRDMAKNYNELKHTKEFDLQTGKEKLPSKVDAIHLEFIKYSHRKKQGVEMGKRQDKAVLDFSSEVTFVPGINVLGGGSGAGKSTLYKLLRHADDLDRGSILFGTMKNGRFKGVPLTSMSLEDANKPIAFSLPELRHVENITGVELIQQSDPKLKKESIKKMAELFEIPLWHDEACKKPKGMDELSSGERKRTLCVSALVSPKPILVLDEPTSGVDGAKVDKILDSINALAKQGKTIIYTTHHPESELEKLDVCQVVDLDRKKTNERGELLPTDVTIQPFNTEEEKKAYINLCNHRNREENKDEKKEGVKKPQTLLEILSENEALEDDVVKADENEYMKSLIASEQTHRAVRVYRAMHEQRKQKAGLLGRMKKMKADSIVAKAKRMHVKTKDKR